MKIRWLYHVTTSTGILDLLTTEFATLPRIILFIGLSPRDPITIRSNFSLWAKSTIFFDSCPNKVSFLKMDFVLFATQ